MDKWIALMGKRYTPTDGVEDYCAFLAQALSRCGVKLEPVHVDWNERGWKPALKELAQRCAAWRGEWVFLQYTALAWSSRGFPFGALKALDIVKRAGAKAGVVFHEYGRQDSGHFLVQPIRGACQDRVARSLYARADLSVFTVPAQKISWLPVNPPKTAFIPIGANIPEAAKSEVAKPEAPINVEPAAPWDQREKTVAVFSFTPGARQDLEMGEIVHAVRNSQADGLKIHLVLLGNGSDEVRPKIEQALNGAGVRLSVLGMMPAEKISAALSAADVLLFVRGQLMQTRGTALAGIACGVPVVGYAGAAEGTQIEDAGLELVPYRDKQALAAALTRVLSNRELHAALRRRSLEAQRKHFSWDAIAAQYVAESSRPEISAHLLTSPLGSQPQSPEIS